MPSVELESEAGVGVGRPALEVPADRVRAGCWPGCRRPGWRQGLGDQDLRHPKAPHSGL